MGDKTCTWIRTKGTSSYRGNCRTQTPPISNRTTLGGFCGAIEGRLTELKSYRLWPSKRGRLGKMQEREGYLEGNRPVVHIKLNASCIMTFDRLSRPRLHRGP